MWVINSGLIELLIEMRQKLREKEEWQLADGIRNK
jgi:cysteinyl-tRNA synthetase